MTNQQSNQTPTYWVTFRIKQVDDHRARYKALEAAVLSLKYGKKWWVEPTSFILFQSKKTIDEVAATIKDALDTRVDMALIGMPYVLDARVVGHLEDPDLFDFMPFTQPA